jgi:hypothetical protein
MNQKVKSDKKRELIANALKHAVAHDAKGAGGIEQVAKRAEEAVTHDFLGGTLDVGGIKLRPFTLATAAMLKEVNSPLIAGVPISEVPNIIIEVMKLIVIQSCPLEEAIELVKSPDKLLTKAYMLADQIPTYRTREVVESVMDELRKSTETQVVPSSPNKKPKETESGN